LIGFSLDGTQKRKQHAEIVPSLAPVLFSGCLQQECWLSLRYSQKKALQSALGSKAFHFSAQACYR
jgi:hypothetical protein